MRDRVLFNPVFNYERHLLYCNDMLASRPKVTFYHVRGDVQFLAGSLRVSDEHCKIFCWEKETVRSALKHLTWGWDGYRMVRTPIYTEELFTAPLLFSKQTEVLEQLTPLIFQITMDYPKETARPLIEAYTKVFNHCFGVMREIRDNCNAPQSLDIKSLQPDLWIQIIDDLT